MEDQFIQLLQEAFSAQEAEEGNARERIIIEWINSPERCDLLVSIAGNAQANIFVRAQAARFYGIKAHKILTEEAYKGGINSINKTGNSFVFEGLETGLDHKEK